MFEGDKLHKEIKAVVTSVESYVLTKAIQWNVESKERKSVMIHEKNLKA